MSRTLGSTHWYRSSCINCSSIICSSHPHQGEVRDPHQRQWWEHQGLRCQACHLHHRQDHHSCELPHCRGRQESNHWSWCNSSQSSSSSSSWKRKVHPSTTSAQSTSSLSSKSLLCIRFGSSRSCSRSSSPLVRPSVHNLRQSVSIQHHCRDRWQNHFRFKENHLGRRESRRSLSASSGSSMSQGSFNTELSRENFMNSLIFHSGHGARFVREQKDFMVSTNISLRRNQVWFSWIIPSTRFLVPLRISRFLPSLRPPHQCVVLSLFQISQQIRLESKLSSRFIMVNGFTHSVLQCDGHSGLMKLQDQVGKDLHCPLKSVPHIHIKVRELLKGFTRLFMVRSGQSNLDSLLILEFILTQQQLVSCHGLFNMLSSPSTETSFVRMARHHTSGCSTRLIQVLWFISGREFWLMCKPSLPPKSFIWGLSLRSTTHCGWGNASSLECTSCLTMVRFSKPEQSPVWSNSNNSILWSSARSFFLLMKANLTINNLKKTLLRSFIMQQKSKMRNKDFQVTVEHAGSALTALSAEGAISNHHQPASSTSLSTSTSSHSSTLRLSDASRTSASSEATRASSISNQKQVRSEEESRRDQLKRIRDFSSPSGHQEKIIFPSLRIRSMQIIKKLNQKKSCFKVSFFGNGIKEIFRVIQQIRSEQKPQKCSVRSGPEGPHQPKPSTPKPNNNKQKQTNRKPGEVLGDVVPKRPYFTLSLPIKTSKKHLPKM